MTLVEQLDAARREPAEVRDSRRRAIIRRMQRLPSRQRERENVELGWRDHGGEG